MQSSSQRKAFKLQLDDKSDRDLWMQTWAAAAAGANAGRLADPVLLNALVHLPASSALTPRVLDVLRAMTEIIKATMQRSARMKMAVVHSVGTAADVVERRLMRSDVRVAAHQIAACSAAVGALKQAAMTALTRVVGDRAAEALAGKVLSRVFMLLERYRRSLEQAGAADEEEGDVGEELNAAPSIGWCAGSVAWLLRGKWLDAPQLQTQYDNIDDYADILRRFVTMLTFFWGSGAVFPKCRVRR